MPFNAPPPDDESTPGAAEAEAAMMVGRLDGALEHCPEPALRIFAGKILRNTLITALRQEGHVFTEMRFHAWLAGLATLSDTPARQALSPRVLCDAILSELAHSTWPTLADLAIRLRPALLAPQDLEAPDAHARVHAIIAEARIVTEKHADRPSHLPFMALAGLYAEMASSITFAPAEQHSTLIATGVQNLAIHRPSPPPPRWAIELVYGEHLRKTGAVCKAMPLPGLIRLDAWRAEDPGAARSLRADGLRDVARQMVDSIRDAVSLSKLVGQLLRSQRKTSRAPALSELLLGFGPLRSAQIESVLGLTRLGVRGVIATLEDEGAIARTTISGSHLYSVALRREPALAHFAPAPPSREQDVPFSAKIIDDFETALSRIDRLLGGKHFDGT